MRFLDNFILEGQEGLEPSTPCLRGRCSNQLSYWPNILIILQVLEKINLELVPPVGFEPTARRVETSYSNPLSYGGWPKDIITNFFKKIHSHKFTKQKPPSWELVLKQKRSNGAGGENRTLITCLEGRYISHYTTPADLNYYSIFSLRTQSVTIATARHEPHVHK